LFQSLLLTFLSWLHWGEGYATNSTQKRKIFNVNVAVFLAIISLCISLTSIYFASIRYDWFAFFLFVMPFLPLFVLVLWLNRWGFLRSARWLLSSSISASVAFSIFFIYQQDFGLNYYFILFAIAPVMFFTLAEWGAILFFYLANIALFIYTEFFDISPFRLSTGYIDESQLWMLSASNIGFSLFTLLLVILFSERAARINEANLEHLSELDLLTQLLNRRGFTRRYESFFEHRALHKPFGALFFIDLDNFKPLNDAYEHAYGDILLKSVAQRLQDFVTQHDVVARFGGDEFIVLLALSSNTQEEAHQEATKKAAQIVLHLNHPYELGDLTYLCTATVGVTLFTQEDRLQTRLADADAAMYQAKSAGRNQFCIAG